jgi:hypothetical protein
MSDWYELIKQDNVWVTRDGRVIDVAAIEPSHAANILPLLRRFAWRMQTHEVLKLVVAVCASAPVVALPDGTSFHDTSDAEDDLMDRACDEDEDAWFERQPLVRALRARAGQSAGAR